MKPLRVYEGTVWIRGVGRVDAKTKNGPLALSFRLCAQACNDRACLKPADHDLRAALLVAAEAPATGDRHPGVFGK